MLLNFRGESNKKKFHFPNYLFTFVSKVFRSSYCTPSPNYAPMAWKTELLDAVGINRKDTNLLQIEIYAITLQRRRGAKMEDGE